MVNTHKLEHSDTVMTNIHSKDKCIGEFCTIHNMSDHIMRSFPQHWREDRSIMERICDHDVGHPDPDNPWPIDDDRWIHGCCGCCGENTDTDSLSEELSDIVQELKDFAYIIDECKGVAVVTMLESKIFFDAACKIERLQKELFLLQLVRQSEKLGLYEWQDNHLDNKTDGHDSIVTRLLALNHPAAITAPRNRAAVHLASVGHTGTDSTVAGAARNQTRHTSSAASAADGQR